MLNIGYSCRGNNEKRVAFSFPDTEYYVTTLTDVEITHTHDIKLANDQQN